MNRSTGAGLLVALVLAGCEARAVPSLPPPTDATPSSDPPAAWESIAIAGPQDGWFADVALVGSTVVAVGGTSTAPYVVTSTDLATWTVVPAQPAFDSAGGAMMASLVVTREGLIAVGPGDSQSVVWSSSDGSTWSKVHETVRPSEEQLAAGLRPEGSMAALVAGERGYVAVGIDAPGLVDDFGGAAWFSADGRSWHKSSATIQLLRAPLFDVATLDDGTFVAVGGIRGAVSLVSPDGFAWTLHEQGDALSRGRLMALARGPDGGLVGVGTEEGAGFSATTVDGARWDRGVCTGALTGAELWSVVPTSGGYLAGGSSDGRAALWVSTDARTWSQLDVDLGEGHVRSVVIAGSRVVAVGSGIWVGPADALGGRTLPGLPCGAPPPAGTGLNPAPGKARTT